MASATGLRLLHIAAVLVMMASSGKVLADLLFDIHKLESTFGVLATRQCLPADFNAASLTAETTAAYQCATKAHWYAAQQWSDDAPTCDGFPPLPLFYNCYSYSLGDLVIVDGVKTFDKTIMENKLMSFTNDASWNLAQDEVIKRCKHGALTSLTPQQRAVYTYMCNSFSLFAHCDHLQADRGALDESGSRRRENFVYQMAMNGIVSGSSVAWTAWTECAQSAGLTGTPVTGWAQRYAAMLSTSACLLRKLFDDGGRLDTGRLFEQAAAKLASAGLEDLVNHCGPSVEGYKEVTAEEFLQCCVKAGPFVMAVSSSNFVASGMPESCTILL